MAFDQKAYLREYRKTYAPTYRANNADYFKELDRRRHVRLRSEAMSLLGGQLCSSCGENESEFLTIEHLEGGGVHHRSSVRCRGVYADIVSGRIDISRFTVLCRNCNCSSGRELKISKNVQSKHPRTGNPCRKCGKPKLVRTSSHPVYGARSRSECPECTRSDHQALRDEVLGLIGETCSCCSESRSNRLTLDHVHNDGFLTRSKEHCGTSHFYRQLLSGRIDISRFQTLCWNCNYSKHVGSGVCVHMRKEVKK